MAQKKLLDEVSEARPLAKLQQELEDEPTMQEEADDTMDVNVPPADANDAAKPEAQTHHLIPSKPLLSPYDGELDRVAKVSYDCKGTEQEAYC